MTVLACSVDSVFVHKAWCDNELSKMVESGIPYPMLSDGDGSIGQLYGVYDETIKMNTRGSFLVDPEGVLQAIEILTPPVGRNIDETIRQIKAFQHVRESGGKEATPVGWEKGKSTLEPSAELVGQVCTVWKVE